MRGILTLTDPGNKTTQKHCTDQLELMRGKEVELWLIDEEECIVDEADGLCQPKVPTLEFVLVWVVGCN